MADTDNRGVIRGRKSHPFTAYCLFLVLFSGGIILGMKLLGKEGLYLAQVYMLTPALAAVVTRLFFYERKFSDASLRPGRLKNYPLFWSLSVAITALSLLIFLLLGAVTPDLSGEAFIRNLSRQFADEGRSINETLPEGFTPQTMLWIFFIGNCTLFNIFPGLVTGFGEEFGHRGFMFMMLARRNLPTALVAGGLLWFLWHLPLVLVIPQAGEMTLTAHVLNMTVLAIGSICTHTCLSYVYVRTKSVWPAALAHITLNNTGAALGFIFIIRDQLLANAGLVLTMVLVTAVGFGSGEFQKAFSTLKKSDARQPEYNENRPVTREDYQ